MPTLEIEINNELINSPIEIEVLEETSIEIELVNSSIEIEKEEGKIELELISGPIEIELLGKN